MHYGNSALRSQGKWEVNSRPKRQRCLGNGLSQGRGLRATETQMAVANAGGWEAVVQQALQ